jgi:peptidoglycan/LPS O-acetylase OafA/YrhL
MQSQNYKYYITGLKGMACLFIMIGHFLGIYKYAESFVPNIPMIDIIADSYFSFVIDEGWWLFLFFVVSGYLVAKSAVKRKRDIVLKGISRFLRLGFPIIFVYIVIYLIYLICGFHTTDTTSFFQCAWYQSFYTEKGYDITDVLMSPFNVLILGNVALNVPYWVLKMMFLASISIYILKYCYEEVNAISEKYESFIFSALVIITIVSIHFSYIFAACLIGMLISLYEEKEIKTKPYCAFWVMALFVILYILPSIFIAVVFFGSLIIFIPRVKWLNAFFSSKPMLYLGKISWGIYSLHWPIICSVGALTIIKLNSVVGLKTAYLISFFAIVILTIILAIIFYNSFEKLAMYLTKK